jgi:hypothetical protein
MTNGFSPGPWLSEQKIDRLKLCARSGRGHRPGCSVTRMCSERWRLAGNSAEVIAARLGKAAGGLRMGPCQHVGPGPHGPRPR